MIIPRNLSSAVDVRPEVDSLHYRAQHIVSAIVKFNNLLDIFHRECQKDRQLMAVPQLVAIHIHAGRSLSPMKNKVGKSTGVLFNYAFCTGFTGLLFLFK